MLNLYLKLYIYIMLKFRKYNLKNNNIPQNNKRPNCVNKIKEISLIEFKNQVFNRRDAFLDSLREGNAYIIKEAINKSKLISLRERIHKFGMTTKESWHDTKEGIPDFHQIDDELKFFKQRKKAHTYHFFSWNKKDIEIYDLCTELLNLYAIINGNRENKFPFEITNPNVVNRLQVHHYPLGGGYMSQHKDPDTYTKTIAVIYMSKYGIDYENGGLYFHDKNNKPHSIDCLVDIGDMVCAYPTITHGCKEIDLNKDFNWKSPNGRWLILFNTLPKN